MTDCYVCMDRGVFFLSKQEGLTNQWNPKTGQKDGEVVDLTYEYVFGCACTAGAQYPNYPRYTHSETLGVIERQNKKKCSQTKVPERNNDKKKMEKWIGITQAGRNQVSE